jgi:hypothetical protein
MLEKPERLEMFEKLERQRIMWYTGNTFIGGVL